MITITGLTVGHRWNNFWWKVKCFFRSCDLKLIAKQVYPHPQDKAYIEEELFECCHCERRSITVIRWDCWQLPYWEYRAKNIKYHARRDGKGGWIKTDKIEY